MPQRRVFFWLLTLCVVLDGATVAALCVGWKLESLALRRIKYLIGCAVLATVLVLLEGLALCVHTTHRMSSSTGAWHMSTACTIIQTASLSALIVLLCLEPSARSCFQQDGPSHSCTIVVGALHAIDDIRSFASQRYP